MLNKLEESKESNKEFMNVTKQTKINRGASSQVPTFWFLIMDEPLYRCKELLYLISWMGNMRGLKSDSKSNWLINFLLKSSNMIALWSPWRSLLERWNWGNDTSYNKVDQYKRKLVFKNFCQHLNVLLQEGFKITKFSK